MDADRFDFLIRTLTSSASRRRALAGVAGIALGLLGRDGTAAKKKKPCPSCKKRKKGKCKSQPNGTACGGGSCQSGSCVASSVASGPACVPESPTTICAGAACGTSRYNNCGQVVACTCPSGQNCLVNGSCAIPCGGGEACPFSAGCGGCTSQNTEGQQHCIESVLCTEQKACTSTRGTSGCPRGTQCQFCSTDWRCVPLCVV